MKERPILFSGAMVRAILDGRKTQTRRVVKNITDEKTGKFNSDVLLNTCPYGEPGDLLWVRQSWLHGTAPRDNAGGMAGFPDGGYTLHPDEEKGAEGWGRVWRNRLSIHMPRWACRIVLEVKKVRVERVNDISEEDAICEGAVFHDFGLDRYFNKKPGWTMEPPHENPDRCLISAKYAFANYWFKINGAKSWAANPWVWVIEFARVPENTKSNSEAMDAHMATLPARDQAFLRTT